MALKPDGRPWVIREQTIEGHVTGLTFQFEAMPDGETRFRSFGKPYRSVRRSLVGTIK